MRNKNDCNGMEVKLDLNEMIKVTACAVYNAKCQMEEYKHKIEYHLEKACYLEDNNHDKYIHLCDAN